ncbi:hypothetical protein EV182_001989, partial [Spiromyces aspiralis]
MSEALDRGYNTPNAAEALEPSKSYLIDRQQHTSGHPSVYTRPNSHASIKQGTPVMSTPGPEDVVIDSNGHHHYYYPVVQQSRQFGSGAPLALVTFAITTMQTNMYKAAMGQPFSAGTATVAASGMIVGGLTQILGGYWQLVNGNSFEAAAFTSFGGFWMSEAALRIPWFGVQAALDGMTEYERRRHLGVYYVPWSIWVFILLLGQVKSTLSNIVLFMFLNLNVHFTTAAHFTNSTWCVKLSGWFGFFTALTAFYVASCILLDKHNFWLNLPVGAWYTEPAKEQRRNAGH